MNQQLQKKRVPELRFPEFNGTWEEKKLGEIVERVTRKNKENNKNVLTISAQQGLINQQDYFNKSVSAKDVTGYYLLNHGEFAYNKSYSKGYPLGAIKRLVNYKKGVVSTLYICFKAKNGTFSEYLDHYFESGFLNREIHKIAQEGARNHGLLNVSVIEFFKDILVIHPSFPEQQKVADFLTSIDTRIQQLTRKVELLEEYKKGMMQKIFSHEIRFKDAQGHNFPDCEEQELGKIAEKITDKNTATKFNLVLTNSATRGIISQQDYFEKDIANQNNLEGYYIIQINDFVYNPRVSISAPVGPIKRNKLNTGVMSPLYTVFRFKKYSIEFFEHYFNSSRWHHYMKSIANYGARHDRMNIRSADFLKMPLPIPVQEEQQKIADFLSSIDTKITQAKEQLEHMQTFKKGLLQKMFV